MGLGDKIKDTLFGWVDSVTDKITGWMKDAFTGFYSDEMTGSVDKDLLMTDEATEGLKELEKKTAEKDSPLSEYINDIFNSQIGSIFAIGTDKPPLAQQQLENMADVDIDELGGNASKMFDAVRGVQDLALILSIISSVGSIVPFTNAQAIGAEIKTFLDYSGITQIVGYGYGQMLSNIMSKPLQHQVYSEVRPALMPLGNLFEAFHRDIINEDYLDDQLGQHGYSDDDIASLKQQQKWFPGPGTAIEWMAKEVFEPDIIEHFGLDAELDTLNRDLLYKTGVNDDQIRNQWIAHWQHPSWRRMRELYARTSVTKDDVMEWMKLVEYPPYWRDQLEKILYRPYTRVDIRRMYSAGVLDEQDVLDAMKEIRFDDDKAEHMKDFYIRWADNDVRGDLNDITIRKYRQDKLNRSDALSTLKDNGVRADKAKTMLDLADLQGPPTLPGEKKIRKWYAEDDLTETETRQYLDWLGYRQHDIDIMITRWSSS